MRQTNTRTVAEQKPLGVIDSISAGLALVWRRPWTLLVPLLFDALIWLLPRLSLTQLIRPFMADVLNAAAVSSDPDTIQATRQAFEQAIQSFNVLGFVVACLNSVTRVPSLLAIDSSNVKSPINAWAFSIPLQSPALVPLLFIPLFLLGLLGVAVYLQWIAQGVRPLEKPGRNDLVLRTAGLWLRLILFSLLLLGFLFLGGVVLILQSVFNSPELAAVVTLIVMVGVFWFLIYFFFVPAAAAVSNIGVRQALRRSTLLFRVFFWSTLGLVALSVFLDYGLTMVWQGLLIGPLAILGIFGNAFIGTALIAASMVYYQDRMNLFERIQAHSKRVKK